MWVAWPQEQTGSEDKAGDTQGPTHEAPASRVMDQLFPRLEFYKGHKGLFVSLQLPFDLSQSSGDLALMHEFVSSYISGTNSSTGKTDVKLASSSCLP